MIAPMTSAPKIENTIFSPLFAPVNLLKSITRTAIQRIAATQGTKGLKKLSKIDSNNRANIIKPPKKFNMVN